jgi:hypothetical protein
MGLPVDIEGQMKLLAEEGRGLYLAWLPEDELVAVYGVPCYNICLSTVNGEPIMLLVLRPGNHLS